jgi:hypothetical protein
MGRADADGHTVNTERTFLIATTETRASRYSEGAAHHMHLEAAIEAFIERQAPRRGLVRDLLVVRPEHLFPHQLRCQLWPCQLAGLPMGQLPRAWQSALAEVSEERRCPIVAQGRHGEDALKGAALAEASRKAGDL